MEPQLVNGDIALLLELIGPFSTVLVLNILPFWSYAFLEEMVVGFEGELGRWSDIVLVYKVKAGSSSKVRGFIRRHPRIPQLS